MRVAVALVDDDVAGEQHAEVGFGLECLVCERRVAGAEDHVRLDVDSELLFQGRLHVDLAQDAEALALQLARGLVRRSRSNGTVVFSLSVYWWRAWALLLQVAASRFRRRLLVRFRLARLYELVLR